MTIERSHTLCVRDLFFTIMTAIVIAVVCVAPLHAQWRQVFSYTPNFAIRQIYFQDIPGPPRIGFVIGNFGLIFKTYDGGYSWKSISVKYQGYDEFRSICFKDTDTGWIGSNTNYSEALFKTTNGGETWFGLGVPNERDISDIYYAKKSGLLFANGWQGSLVSTDEGYSWKNIILAPNCFAFNDDSTGVSGGASRFFPSSWYSTTNAGLSWTTVAFDSEVWAPLAIRDSKTQFAISDYTGVFFRTNDLWNSWQELITFPFKQDGPPIGGANASGCVLGDLSHLLVQLTDGCYMSIDTGKTWKYLCGVPSRNLIYDSRFYYKYPYVYLQTSDGDGVTYTDSGRVWLLNLDSMQYFESKVFETVDNSLKSKTIRAGEDLNISLPAASGGMIGIDSIHISMHYDDAFDVKKLLLPAGWGILDSTTKNYSLDLWLTSDAQPIPSNLLTVVLGAALEKSSAKIYLDSAHFYGKRLNCDCAALSVAGPDSVEIDFTGCGDSTLLRFMSSGSLVGIDRVTPNPAGDILRVEGRGLRVEEVQVFDVMGRRVSVPVAEDHPPAPSYSLGSQEGEFNLDVRTLADGVYYLRIGAASTRFVIQR